MEIYADLATIFHWSIAEMDEIYFDELAKWHTLAIKRLEKLHGG